GEAEYVAEDQNRALSARDVLQGGDERELDAFALLVTGIGRRELILEFGAQVRVRLQPDGLDEWLRQRIVRVGRGTVVDWEHSLGPSLDRLQAGVRGDPIEPGFERAARFESGQCSPRV